MIGTFVVSLCVLAISLYVQARLASRKIRRHRGQSIFANGDLSAVLHRPGRRGKTRNAASFNSPGEVK